MKPSDVLMKHGHSERGENSESMFDFTQRVWFFEKKVKLIPGLSRHYKTLPLMMTPVPPETLTLQNKLFTVQTPNFNKPRRNVFYGIMAHFLQAVGVYCVGFGNNLTVIQHCMRRRSLTIEGDNPPISRVVVHTQIERDCIVSNFPQPRGVIWSWHIRVIGHIGVHEIEE